MTTESRVRTAIVGVRCTPAEHADIRLAAAARGMSASAYMRDLHERAVADAAKVEERTASNPWACRCGDPAPDCPVHS